MKTPNGFPVASESAEERGRDTSLLLDDRIEETTKGPAPETTVSLEPHVVAAPDWVRSATTLWERRRLLFRIAAISLLLSLVIAFALPKQYKSSAQIMPPSNSSVPTAMIAVEIRYFIMSFPLEMVLA